MTNPNWKHQTLTEALEELEANDTAVAKAAANYAATVDRILRKARRDRDTEGSGTP